MSKKTLVLGASLKAERYSNIVIHRLRKYNVETVAIGLRPGTIDDVAIDTDLVPYEDVDTVTLYLNPQRQEPYYEYILSLNPNRVIFNPGTENPTFYKKLQNDGVEVEVACTLVMLGTKQY
ncbi:hypothetical protein SAMN05192588_0020 [Nonlabens sp. Hel1_33_55]|uniref:CoA-binding protein n=1 Tax=Nonlabens sp. Hel1_33_55 TaxID=1336802 RepID=UPI000875E510|nr:CoA-binding protein [Nonlabens sp. Hel1_33_55]SCX87092.1 hypothetical protein SAMN05192588_0020 [Nonlabens sp. Hel1_33_55]